MVVRSMAGLAVLALGLMASGPAWAQSTAETVNQGIVGLLAGSIDGTSMHAASDLAAVLDDGDRLRILPIQGKGSVQAITDLLYLRGIDIALIQRDALEYSRREAIHPNIEGRIRYIARLFNEEVHVVARRDIASIDQLQGQPVNIGIPGSGSDLTAALMFEALGIEVDSTQLDHALALQKLIAGELAAMVYVGGQPTPLFQHLGEEDGLHLLPFAYSPELLELYLPASFTNESYPGLVPPGERVDTISVEAIMAVYNWPQNNPRHAKVARFVETFFRQLEQLQQPPRHRKWLDVRLDAEFAGWQRFAPAEAALQSQKVADAGPLKAEFERFLAERDLGDVPEDLKRSLFAEFLRWQGGAGGTDQDGLTFALVPKAVNNPFFTQGYDGCKQAEIELGSVECLYVGPGEHTEQQQAQILQDLIDRDIDGIAVSPSNSPLMGRVLKRAKDAGIPVITWDSDLAPEDKDLRLTYLGSNNRDIGVNMAKTIQQLKPQGGTICLQTGGAEAANHNERMQGVRDTLAGLSSTEPPGIRLVGQNGWTELDECPLVTDDDSEIAGAQLAQMLASHPELDVFVATGAFTQWADDTYRKVTEPYRSRLETNKPVMVMADTLPMQMAQLKDGLSHAQIGQRPFEMGYRAMFILKDLVEGKPVLEDPIYTALDVCVPANADGCVFGPNSKKEASGLASR